MSVLNIKIARSQEVDDAILLNAPVAIGVSGGKDSSAVALATIAYLDAIGHKGPRVLVHSDLGRVEWKESLPICERLAKHLGLELIVVRRAAGDMLARWQGRWQANVKRWLELSCVKLILPWSTPSMRFCTSELKVDIICRALVKRFPGQKIISVNGVRREESAQRAKSPISKAQPKLSSKTHKTTGVDWHPIIDWTLAEVLDYLAVNGVELHEAYTRYGSTRVSCAFCILASAHDLKAASSSADNASVYREMVDIELESTFSFQSNGWLADVAPHLLSFDRFLQIKSAKERASRRALAEARIPEHLLYVKGWPTSVPTQQEAELLAAVRREVAAAVGLRPTFTEPSEIIARYRELIAEKEAA